MNRFFADTFYWIALLSPRDQWHACVRAFAETLEAYHFYTVDEVLTKFLGSLVFSGVQNYCIIKYLSQHIDIPTS